MTFTNNKILPVALVAGIDHRLEGAEQPLHAAGHDEHVLFAHVDAVALAHLRGDGGAQLRDARRGGVARPVLGERARHRLLDRLGRVEVRLAALELEDGRAARAQFHDAVANLDDVGEADPFEARSEAEFSL